MNIAVLGANGRSGRDFVALALEKGHSVRAGVRSLGHVPEHPNLTVQICDATNEDQLAQLVAGQDVVVSLIGHVKGSPPDVQTVAMKKLVTVLKTNQIERLVCLTGTGVRFPGDTVTVIDRVLNVAVSFLDGDRVKDGIAFCEVVRRSDLAWTIVRVLMLTNGSSHGYRLLANGPAKLFVPRQEVAKAILEVVEQGSFVRMAPIVGR